MDSKEPIIKQWLLKLDQSRRDAKMLFAFLQDIVDKVDTVNDATNKEFTASFLPKLDELLHEFRPDFQEGPVNGVRNVILKVIQKICNHALLPDQLQQIHNTLLEVVENDNEDNALLGLQIIRDVLQKNMQTVDATTMERIEKFIYQQFEGFKGKFERNFLAEDSVAPSAPVPPVQPGYRTGFPAMPASPSLGPASPAMPGPEVDPRRLKLKTSSKDSFKVVAEIYIITLIAMGLYTRRPKPRMLEYLPLIVEDLKMMPSKEVQAKRKDKFVDFLWAQNKMYSIVGYLLRVSTAGEALQKYSQQIADCSINFLKNCPPEHSSVRRSFLPTLKSLTITYIDAYLKHFRDLLDYNVLVGENNERQDLRAEASTIILNVAQYTKDKLNTEQKELITRDLLRMINDITITINIQGTAVLTLNKYIDIISKMPDSMKILMEIIQILTLKFKFLAKYLPKSYLKKVHQKEAEERKKRREGKSLTKVIAKEEAKVEDPAAEKDEERELDFYVETGKGYLKIENDRDRDISDLLRETKLLVQKMIALMQSVINTLCDYGKAGAPDADWQRTQERLEQLSKLFHYGIKYFVTKTAIYRFYGKNITAESDDMDKNVRLFIETFVRMNLASFAQIIDRQIGFLCKCISRPLIGSAFKEFPIDDKKTHDNEFLLKIPQYMRDELLKLAGASREKSQTEAIQLYSEVFAHTLAKYLLRKFKNIGGYNKVGEIEGEAQKAAKFPDLDSQKYSRTLSLFKIVMEIFNRLEGTENIYSFYFNFIVLSAKFSRKAKSFYHYFSVIKSVSRAIKEKQNEPPKESQPREYPPKEFAALLPGLLTIILRVRQEYAVLNELLTEICQYLPVNFKTLVEYLPVLIRPLMDCISPIKIASNIAGNAIKSFEQWFAALSHLPELLDTLYTPMLPEFVMSLHKLFSYQHYTPSIHRILARLGGKSRLYMNEKEAYTKS